MSPKVQMYATGWCPYCDRARLLLKQKNVDFEEIDVDARP
jgi:glutaredoxin 3